MTLQEILLCGGGGVILLLSLIQISPIKINPWSWLAKCFGRAINKDVVEKVNDLKQEISDVKKDVSDLREEAGERNADACRSQILRFGDEILHGTPHSKEHYDNILMQISAYENYCADHPKYMNNVAIATIKHIKNMYAKHLEEDSFLK